MSIRRTARELLCGPVLFFHIVASAPSAEKTPAPKWSVDVEFSPQVHAKPYTGRVYLFFSKQDEQPRMGPNWFRPEPFVSRDVKDWKPGETLTFSNKTPGRMLAYPREFSTVDLSGYHVQAVARFNPYERNVGTGAGNGYSSARELPADLIKDQEPLRLAIDQIVPERKFSETRWTKELTVRSGLLSDFHNRDVYLKAAVRLPASYYEQPERRYPVIYQIPGFGGTHFIGKREEPVEEDNKQGVEFLRVILDPSCPLGHHVFADSANNGPVGEALIKELIPALDENYRTVAKPTARFLTGHSSGGWSSLWLQGTYPDFFGGTWSTAPDPVDFRDFQRINLYKDGENMYKDADGERRPLPAPAAKSCCGIATSTTWKPCLVPAANCIVSKPASAPAEKMANRCASGTQTPAKSTPPSPGPGRSTTSA